MTIESIRSIIGVDELAQEIRRVDGSHSLGAGALAEALIPFITSSIEDLATAAHNVVRTYADMEDGDGNPCPDIAALRSYLDLSDPRRAHMMRKVEEVCTPAPLAQTVGTVEDHNAAFDAANEALGGAFMAGFREGWIYAEIDADGERYHEMAEEYVMAVDSAPQEAWDAHRAEFFDMLPLAAITEVGKPTEPRCLVIGWPPLKKAIWDQVISANLNGGKYISAWDLTDSIYAAALASTTEGQP